MDLLVKASLEKKIKSVATGIESINIDEDNGNVINFNLANGTTIPVEVPVLVDGIFVTDISFNAENHLICTLSDNTTVDVGEIPSAYDDTEIKESIEANASNIGELNRTLVDKLDKYIISDNRSNPDDVIQKSTLYIVDGTTYPTDNFNVTDYIDISDNTVDYVYVYSINNNYTMPTSAQRYCFYDGNKTFISGDNVTSVMQKIDVPVNAKYIRVSGGIVPSVNINGNSDMVFYSKTKKIVPTKTSELINDSGFLAESDLENNDFVGSIIDNRLENTLDNKLDKYIISDNRSNPDDVILKNSLWIVDGSIYPTDNFNVTDYIDISDNTVDYVYVYSINNNYTYLGPAQRYCFYDGNKTFISGDNVTSVMQKIDVPVNAKYIRVSGQSPAVNINGNSDMVFYSKTEKIVPIKTSELINDSGFLAANSWKNKICVTYGDSITAQGNDGGTNGYQYYLNNKIGFSKTYPRGVGGQSFRWNTNTFYANDDGSYNSRDALHTPPEGTTEHKGCFCSWDRITTMIPSNIRETIDLIVVMGGTNDDTYVVDLPNAQSIVDSGVSWSDTNVTDTDWVNDTDFYNGGDYNLSSVTGAVASTIMKMQIWCPNAVIVIATPLSRWDLSTMAQYKKNSGLTIYDISTMIKNVANYMSIPCIDVSYTCCINGFNYTIYIADGVHPNADGQKRLARAIYDGLKTIEPYF